MSDFGGGFPLDMHADTLGQPDRIQLKRLLLWQVVFALLAILIALPFGASALKSAGIGAGVCLLANWVFARRVFRRYRAQQPGELVMRMYGAEVVKIVLILTLFAIAFATLENLNLPALLGAYFAVQVLPAFLATRPAAQTDARPKSEI